MSFQKYTSLNDKKSFSRLNYKGLFTELVDRGIMNDDWYALEKIHGMNFSIRCDYGESGELEISYNSRNHKLDTSASHRGLTNLIEKRGETFKRIFEFYNERIRTLGDVPKSIILFGELAGDGIQRGVSYGDIDFYLFDIYGTFENKKNKGNQTVSEYFPHGEVIHVAHEFGLKQAPIIAKGKIVDMLNLIEKDTFKSLVNLNMENIEASYFYGDGDGNVEYQNPHFTHLKDMSAEELHNANMSEGFVLKTAQEVTHDTIEEYNESMAQEDDKMRFPMFGRLVFKIKPKEFEETKKGKNGSVPKIKSEISLDTISDEELRKMTEQTLNMVTDQRAENMFSKETIIRKSLFNEYRLKLIEDIHDTLSRDFEEDRNDELIKFIEMFRQGDNISDDWLTITKLINTSVSKTIGSTIAQYL